MLITPTTHPLVLSMYLIWMYSIVPGEIFQNNVHKLLQSYKKSLDSINYDLYSEFETNCMEKRSKEQFFNKYLNHNLLAFYISIYFQIFIFSIFKYSLVKTPIFSIKYVVEKIKNILFLMNLYRRSFFHVINDLILGT